MHLAPVDEAAVFGLPHELLGDEVSAAVVLTPGVADAQQRLDRRARDVMTQPRLPRQYLVMDRLPRTTTGKKEYPALRAKASALTTGTN